MTDDDIAFASIMSLAEEIIRQIPIDCLKDKVALGETLASKMIERKLPSGHNAEV